MNRVEFVSYDGRYPNLCSGVLVLKLDGKKVTFPRYSLSSGGGLDDEYETYEGAWSIDRWPLGFPEECKKEATEVVNLNVEHGCCGGCI